MLAKFENNSIFAVVYVHILQTYYNIQTYIIIYLLQTCTVNRLLITIVTIVNY